MIQKQAEDFARLFDVHKRPLPSFAEWLEHVDPGGERGAGFEMFADLAKRTMEQPLEHLQPGEASFARMWMGMAIAVIEMCNTEYKKHHQPDAQIVTLMPRVLACACMYAFASVTNEKTPFRVIAKVIVEEFRAATKVAADALEQQRDVDATPKPKD